MQELKPCPFCNSEARIIPAIRYLKGQKKGRRKIHGLYWFVGCSDPNCILFLDKNLKAARLIFQTQGRDFAIKRWNRRVGE